MKKTQSKKQPSKDSSSRRKSVLSSASVSASQGSMCGMTKRNINVPRYQYSNYWDFMFSSLGSVISYANIREFPYVAASYGGGNYLAMTILFAVVVGIPMCCVEMFVGQISGLAIGKTLGLMSPIFQACLPLKMFSLRANSSESPKNECDFYRPNTGTPIPPTAEYFFSLIFGGYGYGDSDYGTMSRYLLLPVLFTWAMVGCCLAFGIKISIKISYVTVIIPIVALNSMLIVCLTQDGSVNGVKQFFSTKAVVKAPSVKIWSRALASTTWSLTVGTGTLTTLEAVTVAQAFVEHVILIHGAPNELLSDQGAKCLSGLVKEICFLCGIHKIQTAPYHPQTDGLTERFNKTLANILAMYVNDKHDDWDVYLPYATFAYNTRIQDSTHYSPYYLVFGRHPRLPIDSALNFKPSRYATDLNDYALEVPTMLSIAWNDAKIHIETAQARQKRNHDKNAVDANYNMGEKVFIYFPTLEKHQVAKFAHPWRGPYEIISIRYPDVLVKLGPNKSVWINVNRLKRVSDSTETPRQQQRLPEAVKPKQPRHNNQSIPQTNQTITSSITDNSNNVKSKSSTDSTNQAPAVSYNLRPRDAIRTPNRFM